MIWIVLYMAVSLLLWCIKPIGSRRWFPSISWKFRWSRNGRKVDEIEHRGHQIEDFDSKINIPGSKCSRKAEKKEHGRQHFRKGWPDPWVLYKTLLIIQNRNCQSHLYLELREIISPWAGAIFLVGFKMLMERLHTIWHIPAASFQTTQVLRQTNISAPA